MDTPGIYRRCFVQFPCRLGISCLFKAAGFGKGVAKRSTLWVILSNFEKVVH